MSPIKSSSDAHEPAIKKLNPSITNEPFLHQKPAGYFISGAQELIGLGFKVFPIKANKSSPPYAKKWRQVATDNSDQVKAWWGECPDANIGILTDGLVVVEVNDILLCDLSGRQIGTFPNELNERVANNWGGMLDLDHERCPIATTPMGRLYFFRQPRWVRVPNKQIHGGVQAFCDGKYVLAPPSRVDDLEYRWSSGKVPPFATIPEVPAWLLSVLMGGVLIHPVGSLGTPPIVLPLGMAVPK